MRVGNSLASFSQIEIFKNINEEIFLTIEEAEKLLNKEVEKVLDEYDYDNIGDVKVYSDDETSPFYEEAKKILEWYKSLWDWFYEFIDGKEEVNYNELIENYPKFEGQ